MASTRRRPHRRSRGLRRIVAATGVSIVALVLDAGGAQAHVGIAESEQVAGSFALLTFGVPHGCDGSPTTELRIQIPETIPDVTPTVNPNWDVDVVTEQLDEPITGAHGERITERDAEVVYTADQPLRDGLRDHFVLSLQIPEDAAGETLHFPTIQTCRQGETAWIELPEDDASGEALESPAPSIEVVAPDDEAGDGEGSGDDASNGLALAALAVGAAGLGVGGVALKRQRDR